MQREGKIGPESKLKTPRAGRRQFLGGLGIVGFALAAPQEARAGALEGGEIRQGLRAHSSIFGGILNLIYTRT